MRKGIQEYCPRPFLNSSSIQIVARAGGDGRRIGGSSLTALVSIGGIERRVTRVEVSQQYVNVFVEGFDVPALEAVILARAFTVCGAFLQSVGRGLRPSSSTGKTRCTVVDLKGAVHLHGLPDDERRWSLTGAAVRVAESLAALRRCATCLAIFRP